MQNVIAIAIGTFVRYWLGVSRAGDFAARIAEGWVLLDPRTVLPGQEQPLLNALQTLLRNDEN
jgi:hypothetical protein